MLQSIVLRNRRQTKSLASSAAGECLCGRFSLTELTKQAMLPLLLGVELKSDGVDPPNRRDEERPRCLFPASMLAVSSVKADHKVYVSPPENQQVTIWINVSN